MPIIPSPLGPLRTPSRANSAPLLVLREECVATTPRIIAENVGAHADALCRRARMVLSTSPPEDFGRAAKSLIFWSLLDFFFSLGLTRNGPPPAVIKMTVNPNAAGAIVVSFSFALLR